MAIVQCVPNFSEGRDPVIIDKIIDTVMEQNLKSPIKGLIVHHINCESEGQELANKLQDKLGISNIKIQSIGPIIGLHVGPGSIGVAYHY